MKILFLGDAVVSSGFARCTHAVCDELYARGHEVRVLGINYWGDAHKYPYPIYPCVQPLDHGHDNMGVTRLPRMIQKHEPDVVVILNDPWNIPAYLDSIKDQLDDSITLPKIVGWLATDGCNQQAARLNDLDAVAVWTEFAAHELAKGGYEKDSYIVPLGVDTSVFYPRDKTESRKLALPKGEHEKNLFVVGCVGRNQYRKRLDVTIRSFAEFANTSPDRERCRLFLHVGPTGDGGYDLKSLVKYYGVKGLVYESVPSIGEGIPTEMLPYMYSAFDVYLSTSQGEGWGLPAHEAMACGVPCIVPDWGSFGPKGWMTEHEVCKLPCPVELVTAPVNGRMHTIGGIPLHTSVAGALRHAMTLPASLTAMAERGRLRATSLTWKGTGEKFANLLESFQ